MQDALGITPAQWGWVTGVFTLAYAAFEIPSGSMGDRIGPRRVLTRIVVWWSAFTALTGAVSSYPLLLVTRFAFGVGEAGAYPNIGVAIARWFPLATRTQAWGTVLMSAQLGGAVAPFVVVPLQARFGWRASFLLFGLLGVLWAIAWFGWFRDTPAEMPRVSAAERAETGPFAAPHHGLPWAIAIRSRNLLALMFMAGFVGWSMSFFQSWLGTYLVRGRGFTETGLLLACCRFWSAPPRTWLAGSPAMRWCDDWACAGDAARSASSGMGVRRCSCSPQRRHRKTCSQLSFCRSPTAASRPVSPRSWARASTSAAGMRVR